MRKLFRTNYIKWVLFFFLPLNCLSQTGEVDSLKRELSNSNTDLEKIQLQLKIAELLNSYHNKEAYDYAQAAYELSVKNDLPEQKHYALIELAGYEESFGNVEDAKAKYLEVIAYAESKDTKKLLFTAYLEYAIFNSFKNQDETSIDYFLKSLEIAATPNEKFKALNGITNLYMSRRTFDKSCEYAAQAYEIALELKDLGKQTNILSILGRCTMFQRDYKGAEEYLKKTISLSQKSDMKKIRGYSYLDLGQIYWNVKRDTLQAISYFEKGYEIAGSLGDVRLRQGAEMILGNAYLKNKREKEGLALLESSFFEAERKKEYDYAIQPAQRIAAYYEKIESSDSALVWHKRLGLIKDTLNAIKKQKEFKEIETKFEVSEKEKKIDDLESEKTTLQGYLQKGLPVLIGLLLLSFVLFYLFRKNRKKTHRLENLQKETVQQIEELKNIVTKDHILLKDKTKIYIEDLIHIKSDDHYLNIFTSDGKNHFVRGKLSQISEELPPNFIRCHRSYIVNRNFIKQINAESLVLINKIIIPLSRSYKDKFR
ncbi:hypothetical protein GWK08_06520 [Leptobacterium flavescens]|uniref:HTH LytTR-type domain-containing protein n=1 Tax=Leptobacterium flavescens TaxID=472055 RepID=A0A6P0UIG1_9FLAO|nr:LytTR family transcriptional regulator DNA-binding domain-containing protein [Leptobacterium flavescens]NER13085.1 hypothetical protein [Leptobacterium flavescens]